MIEGGSRGGLQADFWHTGRSLGPTQHGSAMRPKCFGKMAEPSDDDRVVHPDDGDAVHAPVVRQRGRGRPTAHGVLLASTTAGRHQAHAFAEVECRVAAVSPAAQEAQDSLRGDAVSAKCFVEAWATELHRLEKPVEVSSSFGVGLFIAACLKAGHSRRILEAVQKKIRDGVKVICLGPTCSQPSCLASALASDRSRCITSKT